MNRSASSVLGLEAAVFSLSDWREIRVCGEDRERFLNSQVTSDVNALADGESSLSALTDARGRLRSFFFLWKHSDRIDLLLASEVAESTVETLQANVIADRVSIDLEPRRELTLALGPGAVEMLKGSSGSRLFPVQAWGSAGFATSGDEADDFPPMDHEQLNQLAVLTGFPRWGIEIEQGMLVSESTLYESAISWEKGCFLGQETVAKIRSGRGPARYPMLLTVKETEADLADLADLDGVDLMVGERKIGRVLSIGRWDGLVHLQASIRREYRVSGSRLDCSTGRGDRLSVVVSPLPWLDPWNVKTVARELHDHASELFVAGDELQAERLMARSVAVDPEFADGHESLGVMYGRRGEYERAIEMMRRLLEVDPESVMAHSNMSLYYNRLGRIEDAEREAAEAAAAGFRKAKTTQPEERPLTIEASASRESDSGDREGLLRRVLEVDPEDVFALCGLSELALERKQHQEALDLLQRALEIDPRYASAYLVLGRAYEGLALESNAREAYESGIEAAAKRGDLAIANKMQERLSALG